MMRKYLFALAALLAGMNSAAGADMAYKAPPVAAAVPFLGFNWSGVYTGVEGGAVFDGFQLNGFNRTAINTNPSSYILGFDGAVMYQPMGSSWVFAALVNLDYGHPSVGGAAMPYWRGMGQGGVGYAFDRVLFLGKAGVVGDRTTSAHLLGTSAAIANYGWTAGAEVDWALNNWLVWKVVDYQFVDENAFAVAGASIKNTSHELKTGLTIRWNGF